MGNTWPRRASRSRRHRRCQDTAICWTWGAEEIWGKPRLALDRGRAGAAGRAQGSGRKPAPGSPAGRMGDARPRSPKSGSLCWPVLSRGIRTMRELSSTARAADDAGRKSAGSLAPRGGQSAGSSRRASSPGADGRLLARPRRGCPAPGFRFGCGRQSPGEIPRRGWTVVFGVIATGRCPRRYQVEGYPLEDQSQPLRPLVQGLA